MNQVSENAELNVFIYSFNCVCHSLSLLMYVQWHLHVKVVYGGHLISMCEECDQSCEGLHLLTLCPVSLVGYSCNFLKHISKLSTICHVAKILIKNI